MARNLALAVSVLLLAPGCPDSSQRGAASLKSLEEGMVSAVVGNDLQAAQRYFLDGEKFERACPERFRSRDKADFRRKLANGMRRFATYFDQCKTLMPGDMEVVRRQGGYKRRQMEGCSESVWEYSDLDLAVKSKGAAHTLSVEGIIGIEGRYYVVERVHCR